MPAIRAPAKVLVTGANGYIAMWVVRELLDNGYTVRGTVRSENKTSSLRKVFTDELENGKLELEIVPDITKAGAFDDAVKDMDAIAHTASPFSFGIDDPEQLINPAVKGTIGILESARKNAGPQLKRVIVLSSSSAAFDLTKSGPVTEDNWNESSVAVVGEKGRDAPNWDKYFASKVFAEKAAWEFMSKNAGSLNWDLVTLLPALVFGPMLTSSDGLGESMGLFYKAVLSRNETVPLTNRPSWVDVRDTAVCHVKALEVPEAAGERFLISEEDFAYQDLLDVANELGFKGIKKGAPGSGKDVPTVFTLDSSKAHDVLGITFRDVRTMVKDTIEDLRARGF